MQSHNESECVRHAFIFGVTDELDHVSTSQWINCQGQPLKAGNDGSLSRCKVVDENHSLEVSRKFTHSIAVSESRRSMCKTQCHGNKSKSETNILQMYLIYYRNKGILFDRGASETAIRF